MGGSAILARRSAELLRVMGAADGAAGPDGSRRTVTLAVSTDFFHSRAARISAEVHVRGVPWPRGVVGALGVRAPLALGWRGARGRA